MEADDDLVKRLKSGDRTSVAQFIEQMRPRLLAFIERQLGVALRRKVEAEDIFQEVSVAAIRQIESVELGDRDPFSWLCQIAEHKIIDAHRHFFDAGKRDAGREIGLAPERDDSRREDFINLLVNSMTTPSQAFSRNAREARLADAVRGLPEVQRQALHLRYVENLPTKQIAEQIGKSDASVRVMLTRAIQQLQAILSTPEK